MKIYALVFYNTESLTPLDHKIYTQGSSSYEIKFLQEFVSFGKKEFIRKMKVPDEEFVIELGGGSFLIYVTIVDKVGLTLLLSHVPILNDTPHIVSRKIISDYMTYNIIPESPDDILRYFKTKEILQQVNTNKKVLLRTVSKVLERGEKIEELVDKTEELSIQSKIFFKSSRKLNSCCWVFSKPRWYRK
jgi:hypothetical protein